MERDFDRVAVVGLGAMGRHIALLAARAGHIVTLVEIDDDVCLEARRFLEVTLQAEGFGVEPQRLLVHAMTGDSPLHERQDLVIEAVPEDVQLKVEVLRRLAASQPEETVFASNTSSLDITALGRLVGRSQPVAGLHFFNPASVMKLVEIPEVPGLDPGLLADLSVLMEAWGRIPLRCAPQPGYVVNRVARPFYLEAQRVLEESALSPSEVDAMVRQDLGFVWGPLEVADFVGHDVNLAVTTYAWELAGRDPRLQPTRAQRSLVMSGQLGKKARRGFYRYDADGHRLRERYDENQLLAARGEPRMDVATRIAVQVISEAVAMCTRDGITAGTIDRAMQLGANWPRGPFQLLDDMGVDAVRDSLVQLSAGGPDGRYRVERPLSTTVEYEAFCRRYRAEP